MTPTPAKIHTLSLHDALPISARIRAAPLMFIRQPTPGPNPPSARFQFRESTHARPARLIRTDDEQWRFPWLAYALGSLFGSSCSCLWLGLACNRRTRSSTTQVSTGLSK